MSFRIELKIPATGSNMYQIKEQLLQKGMTILYPSRQIQSTYFDNRTKEMFNDSEEGSLPRKKIRIRHYPNDSDIKYSLEIKTSSIEGRFKTITPLTRLEVNKLENNGYFDTHYGVTYPTVIVSYIREYFNYKGVRITFDSNIEYNNSLNREIKVNDNRCVIEIKANANEDMNFLLDLISVPLKRFSKYSNAVLMLNA